MIEHDDIRTSFLSGLLEPLKKILTGVCEIDVRRYKKCGDDICNSLGDSRRENTELVPLPSTTGHGGDSMTTAAARRYWAPGPRVMAWFSRS